MLWECNLLAILLDSTMGWKSAELYLLNLQTSTNWLYKHFVTNSQLIHSVFHSNLPRRCYMKQQQKSRPDVNTQQTLHSLFHQATKHHAWFSGAHVCEEIQSRGVVSVNRLLHCWCWVPSIESANKNTIHHTEKNVIVISDQHQRIQECRMGGGNPISSPPLSPLPSLFPPLPLEVGPSPPVPSPVPSYPLPFPSPYLHHLWNR